MDNLQQLFETHIIDLYNAEKQLLRALPKLGSMAEHPNLKSEISKLICQTEDQISRIKRIFEEGGFRPSGKLSFSVDGIMEQTWSLLETCKNGPVMDAAIISSIQKCEHYELRGYYIALAWADVIGNDHASRLLSNTIVDINLVDERLAAISIEVTRAAATNKPKLHVENFSHLEAQA